MRGHTFHQPIEPNKDITMKRKTNTKTKAKKIIKPSQRMRRLKAFKAQRGQGAGSAGGTDGIGKVVTRYELAGVALFTILPDQLERMHPDDMEDLFHEAENSTWRVTLQTESACFVLRLCPRELERALVEHGLSRAEDRAEADAKAAEADPAAPTDDDQASPA